MSKRNYKIEKLHPSNTHYSVRVTDSYGKEHGSFFKTTEECDNYVYEIWDLSYVQKKEDLEWVESMKRIHTFESSPDDEE